MNKKFKSLIISILAIIVFVLAYFFLPRNIAQSNISARKEQILEEELISGITSPENVELTPDVIIREHRGDTIRGTDPGSDASLEETTASYKSYADAEGNTGIKNSDRLKDIINNELNNYNSEYGWYDSLKWNPSLFCVQKGQPLAARGRAAPYGPLLQTGANRWYDTKNNAISSQKDNRSYANIMAKHADGKQKTRINSNYTMPSSDRDLTVVEAYIAAFSERKFYRNDQAQVAFWLYSGATKDELGIEEDKTYETLEDDYINGNELYHEAKALESVASSMVKPQIQKVENQTGTTIETKIIDGKETNCYVIGPFKMNDYTYAYSSIVNKHREVITAEDGTVANGVPNLLAGIVGAKIVLDSKNAEGQNQTIDLSEGEYFECNGMSAEEGKCDCCDTILWQTPSSYDYPRPGSTFYIKLPCNASELNGASKIEAITMDYQYVTAKGKGWDVTGKITYVDWEIKSNSLRWFPVREYTGDSQKMLAIQYAQVLKKSERVSIGNIPLVAKVEINKYISDVNHAVKEIGYDSTLEKGDTRAELTETNKEDNPVYVEYGDLVTYTLALTNHSAFGVKVRIKDEIPTGANIISINIGDTKITSADDLKNENIVVSANNTAIVYVTVQVNQTETTVKYPNLATIISRNEDGADYERVDYLRTADDNGPVVNNSSVTITGTTSEPKIESRDWYTLNDYNASINKYISDYESQTMIHNNNDKFTSEENKLINDDGLSYRANMTENDKRIKPFKVEKGDVITYTIEVKNEAQDVENENGVASGTKKATSVIPSKITEKIEKGLKLDSISAVKYNSNGEKIKNITISQEDKGKQDGNNIYSISTSEILNPGEYIKYFVTVTVEKNNMYLGNLCNTADLTELKNINTRIIKSESVDRNLGTETSSDYVKLKDLVIAGRVWLDKDKDGVMDLNDNGTFNSSLNHADEISPAKASECAMENVIVKLYEVGTGHGGTDVVVRTTKTDKNGLYTFARKEDGTYYNGVDSCKDSIESEQRIPKATGKDANNNYTQDSKYIRYYVEFTYDGLVYKSTLYSGDDNLGANGELDTAGEYKTDSNATEFQSTREKFDEQYEMIVHNKAYTGGASAEFDLSYEKDGHISRLKHNANRIMTSRSFIDKENMLTTKYLWLYKELENNSLPETEYLKYINLGLEERNTFDLSITQDVYEVKTTVNGDELTYEYNQNDYTLGNVILDKKQSDAGKKYDSQVYMTGYKDDSSQLVPYIFEIYNSDYNYRASQYNTETVRDYKGAESELNVEVTYRIRVTNNTTEDNVFAGINEIVEYTYLDNNIVEYNDSSFVDFELDENDEVKTFKVKIKDENGYLVDKYVKVANAEYIMPNGDRQAAKLSTSSLYDYEIDKKEGLCIRPKLEPGEPGFAGDIIIGKGESVDILLTCVVDKKDANIILGDKITVAEINAYSTYYKREDGTYYSAGFVDNDSNAGNFIADGDDLSKYEDDTFKTGITINCNEDIDKERTVTGFVWNDERTTNVKNAEDNNPDIEIPGMNVQHVGDGKYVDTENKIDDMKVQLVEMISIPERDESGNLKLDESGKPIVRVYEDVISVNPDVCKMEDRTNNGGKYQLRGYIPGNYIVKFYYGDNESNNMLKFNGHDYKSTTYQADVEKYAENILNNPDEVLRVLEQKNISDAKDDEIRRLEVISYSETITNDINTILRGQNSSNKIALIENTKMESETAEFYSKTEKVKTSETKISFEDAMAKFEENRPRHQIKNIDFGIENRPKLQISLEKYVSNVQITTSAVNSAINQTPLVNAKFKEYYGIVAETDMVNGKTKFLEDSEKNIIKVDKNATKAEIEEKVKAAQGDISKAQKTKEGVYVVALAGTELDKENSVGLANLQYVENTDNTQGFVYLNIDDEIMQGANISIEYLMVANNLSEIDRVSSNLSNLRFKDNEATKDYIVENKYYDQISYQLGEETGYIDLDYSGAYTARNKLFSEYYEYELNSDNTIKVDDNGNNIVYRIKSKDIKVDDVNKRKITDEGYYGRYLGSVYYSGIVGDKDVIAELKIDKILDYVDNDLVFNESENNDVNRKWKTTTSAELLNNKLVSSLSFKENLELGEDLVGSGNKNRQLLDNKNRAYDTAQRSNLALLVDDRSKDNDDTTTNKDMTKYLQPRYANGANSFGIVKLVASKIISAEDKSEDMTYDNLAEIVQYSSVTGRVTLESTTLGNVKFFNNEDDTVAEWNVANGAEGESDTSATEKVTLTPPTGLGRIEQIVRNTVEGASYTVLIVFAVTIVCVGVLIGIRLYRKRPIK